MKINLAMIKSIVGSTALKLATACLSFFSIPLLLHALGTNNYGTWVTLTALVAWLNVFDFGSGYSLKNKVTEAVAKNETDELQTLIAGTMQFYFIVTLLLLIGFLISLSFVNFFISNLHLALIIYIPVILSFPFTIGHFIIQGIKKFNLFNSLLLAQSVLWLISILLFRYGFFQPDMYRMAMIYGTLFLIVNFCIFFASIRSFKFNWKELLKIKNFMKSKESLLVGGRFFLLQISSLLQFSLGNIMTYNNLQLKDVAQYDTINKIYLMGMVLFNVLISIFWAEISHSKALNDKFRLFKLYKELLLVACAFSILTACASFFIPWLLNNWTKGVINATLLQLIPFGLLIALQAFTYVGGVFLSAFEQIKGQIFFSLFIAVFIIPLTQYFFYKKIGIGSVPWASAILTIPGMIYVIFKARNLIGKLVVL